MNWLQLVAFIANQVPKAVLGVEALVTGAKQGATKKQLAMASLGLASSVATDCVPTDLQPAVTAATSLASSAIDNFVFLMNAAKGKTSALPEVTPASVENHTEDLGLDAAPVIPPPAPEAKTTTPFHNPEWTKTNETV